MILAALLLTLSGGLADEDPGLDFRARLSVGGWVSGGFEFEAFRSDGSREIDGRGVVYGGLELEFTLYDDLYLFASAEAGWGDEIQIQAASAGLGYRMEVDLDMFDYEPNWISVYAAVLVGTIDIDVDNFGDVDDGVGVRAGIHFGWELSDTLVLGLYAEFRFIEFDYEEDILGGDDAIGGGGVAAGLSIDWRF